MKLGNFFRVGITGMDFQGKFHDFDIGIVRKYLSISDQEKKLPNNSFYIVSTSHLYSSQVLISKKIKFACHPFGEKCNHLFQGIKCYDLCESDMVDPSWCYNKSLEKIFDVMCITNDSMHGISCKGFHYIPCLFEACKKANLSLCVVNYTGKKYRSNDSELLSIRKFIKKNSLNMQQSKPKISQKQVNKIMQGARILCVPNYLDASPKIITESIIRGVPVALGNCIVGGTKYIDGENGKIFECAKSYKEFCSNKDYYVDSLKNCLISLTSKKSDRKIMVKNYMSKWGLACTSRRLADILKEHNMIPGNISYVFYPEFKKQMENLYEIFHK